MKGVLRFLWLMVACICGAVVYGQTTYDWLDTAPDGNFKQGAPGARWNPGGLWNEPPSTSATRLRFNNNAFPTMSNNVAPGYVIGQLFFGSSATTARSISGNSIQFFEYGSTWPRIENQSTTLHTINFPFAASTNSGFDMELVASSGSIDLGTSATINNNGRSILIYGNNTSVDGSNRAIRIGGVVSGSGLLNVSQFGVAKINAAHIYTGQTQIDNGEIWIESGGSIAAGSSIFVGNGSQQGNTSKLWLTNSIGGTNFSNSFTINQGNANTREIGGLNSSGTHTFSGNITNNSSNGLLITALNAGGTLVLSGANSGANTNSYNYRGAGIIVLSGNSTYQGISNISGGTLVRLGGAGSGTASPLGNTTNRTVVASGGALDLNGFTLATEERLDLNGAGISGSGAVYNSSATSVAWSGILELSGDATIAANNGAINFTNTADVGGTAGLFNLTLTGSNGGSLAHNFTSSRSVGAVIKNGSGTWTLSGASTYAGSTTINAGTLRISGGNNRLPVGTAVVIANAAGATLDLNNLNQQIGSLSGGGTSGGAINLGSGTLSVGNNNSTTFSGSFIGAGGLIKLGSGTLTLGGTNSQSGPTTISAGTIIYNAAVAMSSNSNIVLAGGTLAISNTIPASALSAGAIDLQTNNSIIDLGTSANGVSLTFADSKAMTWGGGRRITIRNWTPTANKNVFVQGQGLTTAQLDVIDFDGYGLGAKFDGATNRIIPRYIYITQASGTGNFSAPASWLNNDNPTGTSCSSNPATIVIQNGFTLIQDINYDLTRVENNGIYQSNAVSVILCSGGSFVNNGTVNFLAGTLICSGTATFSGTATAANFAFNNLTLNGTTNLTTAPTIRGTMQLNTGGSVTAPPTYGNASILVYNQGGAVNMGNEWTGNSISVGAGIPQNVTIQNNTVLSFPNANRGCAGNFTIGSGGVTLNATSGDLYVAGNLTNNGTFTHNNRGLFMVGGNAQSLNGTLNGTGATNCFPFLLVNKTANSVTLTSNVNVTNTLTLSDNGTITLDNNNLTITSGNDIAGGSFGSNRMIITNGTGKLIFYTLTNKTYLYPIGEITGTQDYSPINIAISSGAGTGTSLGMRVVDDVVPATPLNLPTAAVDYVTRYWLPDAQGFGSISWSGSITYVAGDVVGNSSNLRFSVWHPSPENAWINYGGSPSGTILNGTTLNSVAALGASSFITGRNAATKLYYRSNAGTTNWNIAGNWQTSPVADFSSGVTAAILPPSSGTAQGITIRNNHTVTISSPASARLLTIESGGVLVHSNSQTFNIADDGTAATDFLIQGRYVLNGTQPTLASGVAVVVASNAEVRAIDNTGGGSDNFARLNSVIWQHNSMFNWAINAQAFQSDNLTYFPGTPDGVIPIFRIQANNSIGSSNPTTINGVLQVAGGTSVTWNNGGAKIFRNGIIGEGTLTQSSDCGQFRITGNTSQLGSGSGTLTLNLRNDVNSGLALQAGTCTMLGNITSNTGPMYIDDGATLIAGTNSLSGSGSFTLNNNATLVTANSDGIGNAPTLNTGTIRLSGTKTFVDGANYTFNGTESQTTGNLMGDGIGILTINNPTTVILSKSTHTTTTLNLQAGSFRCGTNQNLNIANGGSINSTGGNQPNDLVAGKITFLGNGQTTGTNSGEPKLYDVTINGSIDFNGISNGQSATIWNRLQINAGSFVTDAPYYHNNSTLVYNTGGAYNRSVEWGQPTAGAQGYPYHVLVQGGTTLNLANNPVTSLEIGGNLTIGTSTSGSNKVDLNASSKPLRVLGNLVIGDPATNNNRLTLSTAAGGDLELGGNFTRYRVDNYYDNSDDDATPHYNGTVFIGSSTSVVDVLDNDNNNRVQKFYKMSIKKSGSAEVTLLVPNLYVENELELINGIVNTTVGTPPGAPAAPPGSGYGLLTLEPAAIVTGSTSIACYVNGQIAKQFGTSTATEFIFPVGKSGAPTPNRPFWFSKTNSGTGTMTGEYFYYTPPHIASGVTDNYASSLLGIVNTEYWQFDETTGDISGRVIIDYKNPGSGNWRGPNGTTGVDPCANCNVAVVKRNNNNGNGVWDFTSVSGVFASSPANLPEYRWYQNDGRITSAVVSTFSPFTIGFSYNVVLGNSQPARLLEFSGTVHNGDGLLSWTMDRTGETVEFVLQHSLDGIHFENISNKSVAGLKYNHVHPQLAPGRHFYRLLVRERNGSSYYSRLVELVVDNAPTHITGLQSTVVNQYLTALLWSSTNQVVKATIYDRAGKLISQQQSQLLPGNNNLRIPVVLLATGLYYVEIATADGVRKTLRWLKE